MFLGKSPTNIFREVPCLAGPISVFRCLSQKEEPFVLHTFQVAHSFNDDPYADKKAGPLLNVS